MTSVVLGAIGWAGFFVLVELINTSRSAFWAGASGYHWVGAWVAALVYAVAVGVLASGLLLALAKGRISLLAPEASALGVWLGVGVFSPHIGAFPVLAVAGITVVAGLARLVLGAGRAHWVHLCLLGGSLAGVLALLSANHVWFLDDDRARYATLAAGAWFVAGGLAVALTRGRRFAWRTAVSALVLALPVIGAGVVTGPGEGLADSERPNLVLITIDTLRADYCSAYGGPVATPNLERLAERGVQFDWGMTLAPWTLPSMTAMFASQYPPGFTPGGKREDFPDGVVAYGVPEDGVALAERLREDGYATAAYLGNALLQPYTGLHRGFEDVRIFGHRRHVQTGLLQTCQLLQHRLAMVLPFVARMRPADTSFILTEHARTFVRRHGDEPFFLWVHYMDPHMPYDPPERYRAEEGPWRVFSAGDYFWDGPRLDAQKNLELPADEAAYVRSLYEGEVRYVDECVGRVLDAVDGAGLGSRSFVMLTADHGEEFWDHGRFAHGYSLYNEQLRAPTMIAGPGIGVKNVGAPFSQIDVMPTLAALLGYEPNGSWRGRSVAPYLLGEGDWTGTSPVFAQANNPWTSIEPYQMVMDGESKLIRGLASGEVELYRYREDALEKENVSGSRSDDVQRLGEALDEWEGTFPHTFSELRGDAERDQYREALQRQLEAMGYL